MHRRRRIVDVNALISHVVDAARVCVRTCPPVQARVCVRVRFGSCACPFQFVSVRFGPFGMSFWYVSSVLRLKSKNCDRSDQRR